jgi:hypothetical protein
MRALHITGVEPKPDGACPRNSASSLCLLDDARADAIRRRSSSNRIAARMARDVLMRTSTKETTMKTIKKGNLTLDRETLVELGANVLRTARGGVGENTYPFDGDGGGSQLTTTFIQGSCFCKDGE